MRKIHVLAGAVALAFALAAVGGAAARSQATTLRIAALQLTAANETPTPKGDVSGARGTFTATLTKTASGAEMSWRLEFSNLSGNATAAHVHVAARGQAGPVRVQARPRVASMPLKRVVKAMASMQAMVNSGQRRR